MAQGEMDDVDLEHAGGRAPWWRRVDWLGAFGQAVVVLAGPVGAPLSFLLAARESLERDAPTREHLNQSIAGLLDPGEQTPGELRRALDDAAPDAPDAAIALYLLMAEQLRAAPLAPDGDPVEEVLDRMRSLARQVHARPKRLRQALARRFPLQSDIRALLEDAGIKPEQVELLGAGEQMWGSVLRRLDGDRPIHLLLLLAEAHERYADVPEFMPGFWIATDRTHDDPDH
jgi:Effector-associated domain 1